MKLDLPTFPLISVATYGGDSVLFSARAELTPFDEDGDKDEFDCKEAEYEEQLGDAEVIGMKLFPLKYQ